MKPQIFAINKYTTNTSFTKTRLYCVKIKLCIIYNETEFSVYIFYRLHVYELMIVLHSTPYNSWDKHNHLAALQVYSI